MTEKQLQNWFRRRAGEEGVLWRKIKYEGRRGCPDILLAHGGKVVLVELKSDTGRLSKLQQREIKRLTDVGIKVKVTAKRKDIESEIKAIKAKTRRSD